MQSKHKVRKPISIISQVEMGKFPILGCSILTNLASDGALKVL